VLIYKKNKKGGNHLQKIGKGIDKLLEISLVLILFTMTVCIFIQIIFRYLVGASLDWTEELARFLQVWLTFLGAGYAIKIGAHITMADILNRLPEGVKTIVALVGDLIVVGMSIFLLIEGTKILEVTSTQIAPGTRISMMYIYLAMPVCGIVTLYYMGVKLWTKYVIKKGESN
jgi:TRAP-type C4-dicarboxylate transport system permease small subunit